MRPTRKNKPAAPSRGVAFDPGAGTMAGAELARR